MTKPTKSTTVGTLPMVAPSGRVFDTYSHDEREALLRLDVNPKIPGWTKGWVEEVEAVEEGEAA